ncbi:MAG: DinB family protein [Acidobacteria bacterium]|nr:DinB family protein [Acidobacteriota bacterium]MBI3278219.1 DinB family protein [Acidobacteriota bacterium]
MDLEYELADLRLQVDDARERGRKLLAALTSEQLNWRRLPGTWSAGECLSHICITDELYLNGIATAIETARRLGMVARGPYRFSLSDRLLVRFLEPPAKFRTKAPKRFTPLRDHESSALLEQWECTREEIVARMERAEGLDLRRVKLNSAVAGLLRFSLGGAFAVMTAHARRHLWQAERLLAGAGFPEPRAAANAN